MDSVFGIFYEPAGYEAANTGGGSGGDSEEADLPEEMAELLARRLAARENKDWATADAVRDEIKALGYSVKVRQTHNGQRLRGLHPRVIRFAPIGLNLLIFALTRPESGLTCTKRSVPGRTTSLVDLRSTGGTFFRILIGSCHLCRCRW